MKKNLVIFPIILISKVILIADILILMISARLSNIFLHHVIMKSTLIPPVLFFSHNI